MLEHRTSKIDSSNVENERDILDERLVRDKTEA